MAMRKFRRRVDAHIRFAHLANDIDLPLFQLKLILLRAEACRRAEGSPTFLDKWNAMGSLADQFNQGTGSKIAFEWSADGIIINANGRCHLLPEL